MHQSKSTSLELVILVLAPLPSLFPSFFIISSFGPVVLGPAVPIPLKSSFKPNTLVTVCETVKTRLASHTLVLGKVTVFSNYIFLY